MTHAIRMHETGGPEVLRWEEIEVGEPGPGQVRIRHTAVGLNYIDTYHRTGLYPAGEMPAILGREAAPVFDRTNKLVACVCFVTKKSVLENPKRREQLLEAMHRTSQSISIALGWRPGVAAA